MNTATRAASNADPNSAAAFGERMRYRLNDMIAHPYSFLPSYKSRYETLLKYAASLTPQQAYAMTLLLGEDSTRLYADMPDTAQLQFPRVNAVDLSSQVGWYYFAGTVTGEDGVEYGILCMLFRYSLLPPPMARHFGLSDLENQVVDLQLAISVGDGRFYQIDPVLTAGTSGQIRVSDRLYLVTGGGSVESLAEGSLFPLRVRARGTDRGGPEAVDLAIELTISSGRPYLPQGLDGAEPLIGGIGTRYYSVPGLVVEAAASSLTLGDRRVAIKSGTLWFDHQWGLGLVPTGASRYASLRASANLAPQSVPGWDFFLMNFDGPYSMTLNSLHSEKNLPFINQTGPKPPPPMDAPVVGKFMDRYGTVFNVSGQLRVSEWRKTNHTPNPAKYTNVPTWVPHGWEITLQEKVVPEHLRRLLITAICDDAQALFFANGAQYVEAATDLIDANDKKMGRGYAEAVSYVDNLPTIISLAGMPVTDELLALFKTTPPSLLMKLGSFLYLLQPWARQEVDRLLQCASLPPTARPSTCH